MKLLLILIPAILIGLVWHISENHRCDALEESLYNKRQKILDEKLRTCAKSGSQCLFEATKVAHGLIEEDQRELGRQGCK